MTHITNLTFSILLTFFIVSCSTQQKQESLDKKDDQQIKVVKLKEESLHESWSYDGKTGPEYWEELSGHYLQCGCGHAQSPIDVELKTAEHFNESLDISYNSTDIDFINNGHTIKELVHTNNILTFGNEKYQLLQFHMHTPAEHYIDHKQAPMELHFVHMNKNKEVAVMAIFVKDTTTTNKALSIIEKFAPKHKSEEILSKYELDLNQLLPDNLSFYHYSGSLTTPPCSEGVKWIIMNNPIAATRDQIEAIHTIINDDNRPLQPLDGRHIYTSN